MSVWRRWTFLADRHRASPDCKAVLWIVLGINLLMFVTELSAGVAAGSASLQADALDFLGDAANYLISLAVFGMVLRYRSIAALAKGLTMGMFGFWVFGTVVWHALAGTVPQATIMGIGLVALLANTGCAVLLYAYRDADANMQSVWICSRNDVLGNLAVLLAALGVSGTGSGWPDLVVAAVMASLALQGATVVTRRASQELQLARPLRVRSQ
jgi:Co/Zn/Cd efflux system component